MNELPTATPPRTLSDVDRETPEQPGDSGTGRRASARWRASLKLGTDRFSGLYVLALIVLVFGVWVPETFLTLQTLNGIASQQAITAILAIGVLAPYAAGAFDLSVGSMLGLSVVIVCKLQADGVPWVLAVLLTLTVGAVVGLINGYIIVGLHVDSFIATLGMSAILGALVYWVSGNQTITEGLSPDFIRLGQDKLWGVPLPVWFMIGIALVVGYITELRPLGRKMYATGGNEPAARLSGINTSRMVVVSLMLSGTVAAFAGVIFAATIGSASLTAGPPFLLPAYAAVFLGATQIYPGRANVLGTLVAVAVLGTGVKGLLLTGAEFWVSDLFNGLTLILAVALAMRRGRSRA